MYKSEKTTIKTDGEPLLVERDSSAGWMGATLVIVLVLAIGGVVLMNNSHSQNEQAVNEQRQSDTQRQQAATQQQQNSTSLQQAATQAQQSTPLQGQTGLQGAPGATGERGATGSPGANGADASPPVPATTTP